MGFDQDGAKFIAQGLMPRFCILERLTSPARWLVLDFPSLAKTLRKEIDQRRSVPAAHSP